MNYKDPNKDSGNYVDGMYTTKNGFSNSGLNCPKGTRLYDTKAIQPIIFVPEDTKEDEEFKMLERNVAPDVMPYYAISNYGRLVNIYNGKVMKENYRPNGYGYYCLASENSKTGQKKYTSHRIVLKTFNDIDGSDALQVNHIDGDKTNNSLSNLEWMTSQENAIHRTSISDMSKYRFNWDEIDDIRKMHDEGYSYVEINKKYNKVSSTAIQNICCNRVYVDPNYSPKDNYYLDSYKSNPAGVHKLTDNEANLIRKLHEEGYTNKKIKEKFFPKFSESTISDIIRGVTHNR